MPPFKKPKIEIIEDETGVKKARIGQKEFPAIAFASGSKMEVKSSENDGLTTTLFIDGKPVANGYLHQVNNGKIYFVPIDDLAGQTEEKRSETFKSLSLYSKEMAEKKKAEETKDAAITSNQPVLGSKSIDVELEKIDKEFKQIELEDLEHRLNESTRIIKELNQIVSEYLAANNQRDEVKENYQQCQKALDAFKTSFESEDVEKANECKDTYNTIKDCLKKMLGDDYEVPKWGILTQEEEKIRKDMDAKLEEVEKNYNEKETKLREAPARLEQYLKKLAPQGLEGTVQTQQEAGTVAPTTTPAQAESTSQYQQTQQTQQLQAQETTKTLETAVAETKTPQQPQAQETKGATIEAPQEEKVKILYEPSIWKDKFYLIKGDKTVDLEYRFANNGEVILYNRNYKDENITLSREDFNKLRKEKKLEIAYNSQKITNPQG